MLKLRLIILASAVCVGTGADKYRRYLNLVPASVVARYKSAFLIVALVTIAPAHSQEAVTTKNIKKAKHSLLVYLKGLSSDTPHGVLSGQWVSGPSWPAAYDMFVESLEKATGKGVAILGSDYSPASRTDSNQLLTPPTSSQEEQSKLTLRLFRHWQNGGLVTLTWFVDNPWQRSGHGINCSGVPKPCTTGSLRELMDLKTQSGRYFRKSMDDEADKLRRLRELGVVVLFRPFHEMNGNWFWWGVRTQSHPRIDEFVALWRYVHNYFEIDRKLNNLLWVYAPANSELAYREYPRWEGRVQPTAYYYPGAAFVDIVGLSYYHDRLAAAPRDLREDGSDFSIPTYGVLENFHKPLGLAEFGPSSPRERKFDFDASVHALINAYPKIAFFTAWQDDPARGIYLSIASNPNPQNLMDDSIVIKKGEINFSHP